MFRLRIGIGSGRVLGFIVGTIVFGGLAWALLPSILSERAGLPAQSQLLSASGVPTLASTEGDYFTLPDGSAYFSYPSSCGEAHDVYAQLRNERAPINILYGREIHTTMKSAYAYREVYEIRGEHIARSYGQCERSWIESNRGIRYFSIPLLALVGFGWLRGAWRLVTRTTDGPLALR